MMSDILIIELHFLFELQMTNLLTFKLIGAWTQWKLNGSSNPIIIDKRLEQLIVGMVIFHYILLSLTRKRCVFH